MNPHTKLLITPSLHQRAALWLRALPACVALTLLAVPELARAQTAASGDKDAQIASLSAEIERLKAALSQVQATPAAAANESAAERTSSPSPLTTANTAGASRGTVLELAPFEVRTTQGVGYSPGNSASALKTSEQLMKLPAQIILVSSDMIKDIGSHYTSDILMYAGLVPFFRGPAIMSRGSRIGNAYIDDVPQATGIGVSDNTNIDTYQVIKGAQQALYPLASLAGLVVQTTKKPLPGRQQSIFDLKFQQWGRHTATFDINQPLSDKNGVQFTARVVGIHQSGQGPFYNSEDGKFGIFPSLALDWKNTNITLQLDRQIFHYLPGGTGILTPDGSVYTGLGRRNQNSPRGNTDTNTQNDARISWTQRISDNWQIKSQGTFFNVNRAGSTAFPTTVNWNTNTMTYTVRRNQGWNESVDVQTDVSGQFKLGSIVMRPAFGYNMHDQTGKSEFWVTVPTVTIPIGDAAAINNIVLPAYGDYPRPTNPGSRSKSYVSNAYFMQTADLIPDRLTAVAGVTYSNVENVTDTDLSKRNPYTAINSNAHELLHRVALVGYLTKDITVYASDSSTFNPAVGVDVNNAPLPSVLGKAKEVGFKTSFWDGKLSTSVALYSMSLTNQAILAAYPALNVAGLNYYIPVGTTDSKGWDFSLTMNLVPGWQLVATGYRGTVHDQNGNPLPATVENSWSVFTRYDFNQQSGLKGFSIGGGAAKAGGKWFTMAGMILPGGAAPTKNSSGNAVFKLKQEVLLNLFANYQMNRRWSLRLDCENVLDSSYAIGAQGVGLVDSVNPRTFSIQSTYKY
jgi:outer membrane receptor for ferric coprogen and ferric-rhodotorulic acid